ncbi:hypothetical protein [Marixanthotalea marina]|nr:hypothetical protein [Marixanthotalea marina]
MNSYLKISKHTNTITREILTLDRKIHNFKQSTETIWKGVKRYYH